MHQFINLWKVHETSDSVEYSYGIERESSGLIDVSKQDGRVRILRNALDLNSSDNEAELIAFAEEKFRNISCEDCFPESLYFA